MARQLTVDREELLPERNPGAVHLVAIDPCGMEQSPRYDPSVEMGIEGRKPGFVPSISRALPPSFEPARRSIPRGLSFGVQVAGYGLSRGCAGNAPNREFVMASSNKAQQTSDRRWHDDWFAVGVGPHVVGLVTVVLLGVRIVANQERRLRRDRYADRTRVSVAFEMLVTDREPVGKLAGEVRTVGKRQEVIRMDESASGIDDRIAGSLR